MSRVYIGIDPGANGASAFLNCTTFVYPTSKIGMVSLSETFENISSEECFALIESVHSMPGQGVVSSFNFGHNFGMLEGLLIGAGIPYDRVTPQKWQKEFGLYRLPDETKTAKKNRHKELAKELFPTLNVTHATADALLIAEYARRTYE